VVRHPQLPSEVAQIRERAREIEVKLRQQYPSKLTVVEDAALVVCARISAQIQHGVGDLGKQADQLAKLIAVLPAPRETARPPEVRKVVLHVFGPKKYPGDNEPIAMIGDDSASKSAADGDGAYVAADSVPLLPEANVEPTTNPYSDGTVIAVPSPARVDYGGAAAAVTSYPFRKAR
jgi:hypothetical protein